LSTATTAGVVDSVVIDVETGGLAYLVLKKVAGSATLLPWSAIRAVGPDAITIGESADLVAPHGPQEERAGSGDLNPLGKSILTEQGEALGTVEDVVVDTTSGTVEGIVIDGVTRDEPLVGSGAYAVIIQHA
jgi:sporulation protein YlmC with PRC-barrel domain